MWLAAPCPPRNRIIETLPRISFHSFNVSFSMDWLAECNGVAFLTATNDLLAMPLIAESPSYMTYADCAHRNSIMSERRALRRINFQSPLFNSVKPSERDKSARRRRLLVFSPLLSPISSDFYFIAHIVHGLHGAILENGCGIHNIPKIPRNSSIQMP